MENNQKQQSGIFVPLQFPTVTAHLGPQHLLVHGNNVISLGTLMTGSSASAWLKNVSLVPFISIFSCVMFLLIHPLSPFIYMSASLSLYSVCLLYFPPGLLR